MNKLIQDEYTRQKQILKAAETRLSRGQITEAKRQILREEKTAKLSHKSRRTSDR